MLIPTLTRGSRNISFNVKSFTDRIGLTTPLSEILLESITCLSPYGPQSITITQQKLAVLHYLKKHMPEYKDLFKLKEKNNSDYDYNPDTDEHICTRNNFYEINQSKPIYIYKKGNKFLRIKCYDDIYDRESNRSSTNQMRERVSKMMIQSNKGLKPILSFIDKCSLEYEEDKKKDKTRYMFTYLGLNNQKKPIYEQHEFNPYASFDGLVGDIPREIRKDSNSFQVKKAKNGSSRNHHIKSPTVIMGHLELVKHFSVCCSTEHNLHIVRIRLSDIKDKEFVKVLEIQNIMVIN